MILNISVDKIRDSYITKINISFMPMSNYEPELSIILPCLNEENGLKFSLEHIFSVLQEHNLSAEILIIDNGSTDRSVSVAKQFPSVRIIEEKERGYGSACRAGLKAANGTFLLLADCDGSYDFDQIPLFLEKLTEGFDFVIGNRFNGQMHRHAMPWAHRHIGNPILSGLLRIFFRSKIHDAHCGLRAIRRSALERLNLRTIGMEFASEMVIKCEKLKLKTAEIPVNYNPRLGCSKLKSLSDGWRHLRFMLLYSPLFLFFLPGVTLLMIGSIGFFLCYVEMFQISGIRFQEHPLFVFALFIIIGYQLVIFAMFSKTYAITHFDDTPIFEKFYRYITIEKAGFAGIILSLIGAGIYWAILQRWLHTNLGALNEIKNAVLALTLITVGIQTIFSSFMLSILGIKEK